jgi:hypothetical protein
VLLGAQEDGDKATILASTYSEREGQKVSGTVDLRVAEGLVIDLE